MTVSVQGSDRSGVVGFSPVAAFRITIGANDRVGTRSFVLSPINNSRDDSNETVTVGGQLDNSDPVVSASIRLIDDDGTDEDGNGDDGDRDGDGGGGDGVQLSVIPVTLAESAPTTEIRVTATVTGDDDATYDEDVVVTVSVDATEATGVVGFEPIEDFDIEIRAGRVRGIAFIDLTPIDDNVAGGDATIRFSGTLDNRDPVESATLTLTDDDDTVTELTMSLSPEMVAESAGATTITVTVGLQNGMASTNQTVSVTVAGSGAAGVVQFARVPSFNVTIPAGQSSGQGTFSITPVNNTFDEKNETVKVFGTLGEATVNAEITITDDDAVPTNITLSVSPSEVAESAGPTTVTVTATVDGASTYATDQTVPISVAGSETSGAVGFASVTDFHVMLARGQRSGTTTFALTPEDDVVDEMDETITISSTHSAVSAPTTLKLTDDDAAPSGISLSLDPTSVDEGAGATRVTVTATVEGGTTFASAQTVDLSAAGSGMAGVVGFAPVPDFSFTITAAEAAGTATFTLNPEDNEVDEADEVVTLSSSNANVRSAVRLTIVDDDETPTGISLALDPSTISEGLGETTVAVTASVQGGTTYGTDQTVGLTVTGTGAPGVVGFAPVSNFELTVRAGEGGARATFTITPENNVVDEENETITVSSSNRLVTASVTLQLLDDDAAPTGVSLAVNPAMVAENVGATSVTVTAIVEGGTTYSTSQAVAVAVAGSGAAGVVGFAPVSGMSVSIPSGAASGSATFTLTPTDNIIDEANETITLTGSHMGMSPTATLTLADDDDAPTGISIAVDPATVSEGAGATSVNVNATVEGGTLYAMDQTVSVTVSGSGNAGAVGFAPVQAFDVLVMAGTASAVGSFTLTPEDNREREADETLTVSGQHLGQVSEATITLVDNDHDVARTQAVTLSVLPEIARAMASSSVGAVANRIGKARSSSDDMALSVGGYSSASSLVQGLRARQTGAPVGWRESLHGTSFTVTPMASAAGLAGRVTIWGEGDYRTFSGNDDIVGWDGKLTGMHLGADASVGGGALVGVAYSRASGAVDYTYSGPNSVRGGSLEGTYDAAMQSIVPYASWTWAAGSSIWASAGFGSGEVEVADAEISNAETADSRQGTLAIGANVRLLRFSSSSAMKTLDLKSEAWQSKMEVDANGSLVDDATVNVNRVRVLLEGAYGKHLAGGGSLTPFVELGLRSDGGDGRTGLGVELGGGLRFAQPSAGLRIEGRGRTLLAHGGDVDEWGVGGSIGFTPGEGGRGMSFELGSSSGSIASGMQRIWSDRDMAPGTSAFDIAPRLHSQFGYGLDVRGGLLRPYGGMELSGPAGVSTRIGTQYRVGARFSVGLEVAHYALPGETSAAPMLRGVVSIR